MTRSSTGGLGPARGVGHESRCLAWGAAYMLAEKPLPRWASGRQVVAVGGQTKRPVDDGALLTDLDGSRTDRSLRQAHPPGSGLPPLASKYAPTRVSGKIVWCGN
jgi:hypothetical protein